MNRVYKEALGYWPLAQGRVNNPCRKEPPSGRQKKDEPSFFKIGEFPKLKLREIIRESIMCPACLVELSQCCQSCGQTRFDSRAQWHFHGAIVKRRSQSQPHNIYSRRSLARTSGGNFCLHIVFLIVIQIKKAEIFQNHYELKLIYSGSFIYHPITLKFGLWTRVDKVWGKTMLDRLDCHFNWTIISMSIQKNLHSPVNFSGTRCLDWSQPIIGKNEIESTEVSFK